MKTKISRIMGVGLALLLVLSLAFALVPTKAEAAPCAWTAVTIPGPAGNVVSDNSDVTDLAVANDGATVWAVDAALNRVLISTSGGRLFDAVAALPGAHGAVSIAVAPDNPLVALVSDNLGCTYFTTNGGISWAALGAPVAAGWVTDVAVSPAMAGSILGRYYFATVADNSAVAGTTARGDVLELGTPAAGATWTPVAAAVTGIADFMAIEVTPGFVGDQTVCVVGSNWNLAALLVININTGVVADNVAFTAGPTDDYRGVIGATSIAAADIALPIDFDSTFFGGIRAYVSIGSNIGQADNDVYRVDGAAFRALNAVTNTAIYSLSYSGVIDGGSLFLGEKVNANVRYSNDPTTGAPSWYNSAKSPTGGYTATDNATTVVAVSPNFSANSNVFAATTGAESALSLSYNGGKSFNQICLIDTVLDGLTDVMPTPDGATIYLATCDNGSGSSDIDSLWKSAAASSVASWDRIRVSTTGGVPADWADTPGDSIIRLNPDFATTPRLYWADEGGTSIQTSGDGGDTYSNRIAPAAVAAIQDMVAEDGSITYIAATGAINVFRSANAAYVWGPPVNGQAGAVNTLAMAPSYPYKPVAGNVLVGGASAAGYSLNGGTSFARLATGLPPIGAAQVLADQNYATNNTIYCGGATFTVYRFAIGTSGAWDNLISFAVSAVGGLGMENGVFYSLNPGPTGAGGAFRAFNAATDAPGTIDWRLATAGATPAALGGPSALRVAGGTLYAIDTTALTTRFGTLVAYSDSHQTAAAAITSPAGGAVLPIDPVNGRAMPVILKWGKLGVGTGLANAYLLLIFETAAGVPGASVAAVVPIPPAVSTPTVRIVNPAEAAGNDIAYTFFAGREYGITLEASGEVSGDNVTSPWSVPVLFSIEEGVPQVEMTPPLTVPPVTIPPIEIPPAQVTQEVVSPAWIWAVVIIGAILVIAVIVLIVRTRRV